MADHEVSQSYDLTLTAADRGSPQQQTSSVGLRVNVMDANDHPPVFDRQVGVRLIMKQKPYNGLTIV